MFLNYYIYILNFPIFISSILMILLCNSWFSMWMIMEINLIIMIMMIMFDKYMKIELLMKYYLFQSLNSYLYLINSLGLFCLNFMNSMLLMNFSMLMKLSIIPFHFWYFKIMQNLNWMNIYFFSVINKFIPLYILMNLFKDYSLNMLMLNLIFLLISSLFSSLIGLNQLNIKLIFSVSSMIQMSWIIILMIFNEMISFIYLMIYNLISLSMYLFMYMYNFKNLIEMNKIKFMNKYMYMFMMFNFFSLSGLPPFFGFLMKWISIKFMVLYNFKFLIIFLMILNTLISMFFYFRLMYLSMMIYYLSIKINFNLLNLMNKLNMKYLYILWFSMIMLISYEIF